jgi:hypothetical protein
MHRVTYSISLIAIVGCSVVSGIPHSDRLAVEELAVRYMAGSICKTPEYPCAVVFVSVGNHDPASELLDRLRDLNAVPVSRTEYFTERPGDVWRRTREKGTGRRGEVFEITAVRRKTAEFVHVSVRYGVTSSVLVLTRRAGEWVVASENTTAITVA